MVAAKPRTNDRRETLFFDRQAHHVRSESLPGPRFVGSKFADFEGNGASGERGGAKLEDLKAVRATGGDTLPHWLREFFNPCGYHRTVRYRCATDGCSTDEDVGTYGRLPLG